MIEFVTYDERAAKMFAPKPAMSAAPEWFKKTPLGTERRQFPKVRLRRETTIKGCPGVADYLGLGYVMLLATDYLITAVENGFNCDSLPSTAGGMKPMVDVFRPDQWAHFPRREGDHNFTLKLPSPWMIRTPPGWSTMVLAPWFHQEERFTAIPGVIETDRYGVLSPILVWHCPLGETTLLKAGTPLVHLVPFRRGELTANVVFDIEKWKGMIAEADFVAPDRMIPGSYREHARWNAAT
ncbi:MAG TPA: hypothetical protein VFI41_04635 [Gemmatimonadales bacterium]|nr:hypothetical protein [Gemmatimonadales bacterium]